MSLNEPLPRKNQVRRPAARALLAATLAACLAATSPAPLASQFERSQEIVANLAAGRVLFLVARDAILVATVEGQAEPGSQPPAIISVNSGRIGVVLGANEWSSPGSGQIAFRFDAALPRAATRRQLPPAQPGISQLPADPIQPIEIEQIGIAMLEVLRPQVAQIHHKLDLAPNEPLVELLLADYVAGYGPEVWSLQYRVRQQNLGNDFWDTRPLRPAYLQLYPPERGKPRTYIEVSYPANMPQPGLIDQLNQPGPPLDRIASATPQTAQAVAAVLKGESNKASAVPLADFLRAALPVLAGGNAKLALARLDESRGFQWLLAPAEPPPTPAQSGPQEPERPSLRKYTQPK
jgi:hypothetical protein